MKAFTLIIFVLISSALSVAAQTSDRERGIEAFNQKKYAEAIGFFEKAIKAEGEDITSLCYLGQAFENLEKKKEAAQNYTRCYQKGVFILEKTFFESVNEKDPLLFQVAFVKNKIGAKLELALKSAERLQTLDSNSAQNIYLQNALLMFKYFLEENKRVPENASATGKLKVLKKPNPSFTKQARKNLTSGQVHLYVMFLANGKIGIVIPKTFLPDDLTQAAIEAARKIEFEPQTFDGKPVTTIKTVVYSFII